MSYLVLARKYRPRSFEQLVGQEHVVQALANALQSQRLHHAYLFTGTRGVGKTTVSRILAKSLNCTGPDGQGGITPRPCGRCDACRDIDAGRHVDYIELDAASNRGVEEITQLLDQAVYKPVVGRFKVYMIDEVHMLSNTAFNAMLKTLEEPPDYLKFVLATTDPQKVPPTVLSRCLQFNLRPMAPSTVQAHLAAVLAQEDIAADAGALRLLARAARGSMRDALSLTDQAIAYGAGRLEEAAVRQMLGAVDRSHAVRAIEALAQGDARALVGVVDELRAAGLSAPGLLDELAAMLQQMAVLQAVADAGDEDDPDTPVLRRLAGLFAPDETQFFYSVVLHGGGELLLAPDEYSGLVMVLLRMLAFKPGGPAETVPAARPAKAAPARAGVAALAANPPPRAVAPIVRASAAEAAGPAHADLPADRSALLPDARDGQALAGAALASQPAQPAPGAMPGLGPDSASHEAREAPRGSAAQPGVATTPDANAGDARFPPSEPTSGKSGSARPGAAVDRRAGEASEATAGPEAPGPCTATALGEVFGAASDAPFRAASGASSDPTGDAISGAARGIAVDAGLPLGDRWADVVARLVQNGAVTALARELAMQAQLVGVDAPDGKPPVWRLRVERESLRSTAQREKVQAALASLLNEAVNIEIEPGAPTDSPALREAAERARRQADAEQTIRDDPLVQSLMQQYRTARIVPGSIKPTAR